MISPESERAPGVEVSSEKVVDAAVLYEGKIFQGTTHGHALAALMEYVKTPNPELYTKTEGDEYNLVAELEKGSPGFFDFEGFVTSSGRYINRKDALVIAQRERQLTKKKPIGGDLYSEDLKG